MNKFLLVYNDYNKSTKEYSVPIHVRIDIITFFKYDQFMETMVLGPINDFYYTDKSEKELLYLLNNEIYYVHSDGSLI